jgi:hypothetical protein
MPDRMFYVRAQDEHSQPTSYVGVKFLTLDGKPVMDPTPGGSQIAYIYADSGWSGKKPVGNPPAYLRQRLR